MRFREILFRATASLGIVIAGCGNGGSEADPFASSGDPSAAGADSSLDLVRPPTPELSTPTPVPLGRPGVDPLGPTPAAWTMDATTVEHSFTGAALLVDARASANAGFDRIVLEFAGDQIPAYHIEYVDAPITRCGSGETVEIEGDARLLIRLSSTNAHRETGQPSVIERSQRPDLPVVRELTLVCDFEGQVDWVLGVTAPNRYRVMELVEPARLIVDVRH